MHVWLFDLSTQGPTHNMYVHAGREPGNECTIIEWFIATSAIYFAKGTLDDTTPWFACTFIHVGQTMIAFWL